MSDESWLLGDEHVKPQQPSGWIEWKGADRAPVNDGCMVEVLLRSEDIMEGYAGSYDWTNEDNEGDIIKYRVLDWAIDLDEVFERPNWQGCPLPRGTKITTQLQNGRNNLDTDPPCEADQFTWHIGDGSSIVKYRIVETPDY